MPPSVLAAGTDLFSMVALEDLNFSVVRDGASNAAAAAEQAGAGATGTDNLATYVETDANNGVNLSDSGASTVAV